ncbi:MAG: phage integrase SAM-like domain-containing protein [Bacteroidales bacterium]|jgi:integrase/recombinase XerD
MNIKIAIRKKPIRKDGTVNIKILLTHQHASRYLSTDYYVIPKYFDNKSEKIKPGGGRSQEDVDRINAKLLIRKAVLTEKAEKLDIHRMDIRELVEALKGEHREINFFSVIDDKIKKYTIDGNVNYAGSMRTTKNLVQQFVGGPILPFSRIDYNFLNRLDNDWRYIRKLSETTIGIYMRNIRTVWNEGRKIGMVDASRNPFLNYKIQPGTRRNNMVLTPTEMATIAKIRIDEPLMAWARDMAMLSLCLIGINFRDLFYVKELRSGRISYKRSKGKKEYSIKVPPQGIHIINRYKGTTYLLNTLDNYADYRSATKRINKKLKYIAVLCKIEKNISLYTFRHSWSAYARYLGISKDDIAAALGHRQIDLPQVTEFYDHIEEEQRRVDLANKKVIRLILRTPPKEL